MKTVFDRIDLSKLYPPFVLRLQQLDAACQRRGAVYIFTSGLRDYEEQARVYAIGRTTDKNGQPIGPGSPLLGRTVSNAKPGSSAHNFGIGGDATFDANANFADGLQPADDSKNYIIYAEEAEKVGLEPGYRWSRPDTNHVQLPLKRKGLSMAMLDAAYRRGGMPAVFALLEKAGPW